MDIKTSMQANKMNNNLKPPVQGVQNGFEILITLLPYYPNLWEIWTSHSRVIPVITEVHRSPSPYLPIYCVG